MTHSTRTTRSKRPHYSPASDLSRLDAAETPARRALMLFLAIRIVGGILLLVAWLLWGHVGRQSGTAETRDPQRIDRQR